MLWKNFLVVILLCGFLLAGCQPAAGIETPTAIASSSPTVHPPTPTDKEPVQTPTKEAETETQGEQEAVDTVRNRNTG